MTTPSIPEGAVPIASAHITLWLSPEGDEIVSSKWENSVRDRSVSMITKLGILAFEQQSLTLQTVLDNGGPPHD